MKTGLIALLLAPVLLCAIVPRAVAAQATKSQTAGLYLNAHFNGSAIKAEDSDDRENGGGIGLAAGYGFSKKVMVFLNIDGANMNGATGSPDYTLAHIDIGVRYSFANSSKAWIPFINAAVTGRGAMYDNLVSGDDLTLSGGAGTLGGGITYHFSPSWGLEGSIAWSAGKFTDAKVGSDKEPLGADAFKATSSRLSIGVSFNPKK